MSRKNKSIFILLPAATLVLNFHLMLPAKNKTNTEINKSLIVCLKKCVEYILPPWHCARGQKLRTEFGSSSTKRTSQYNEGEKHIAIQPTLDVPPLPRPHDMEAFSVLKLHPVDTKLTYKDLRTNYQYDQWVSQWGEKANLKDEYLFSNSGDNWREDVGNEQRKMK